MNTLQHVLILTRGNPRANLDGIVDAQHRCGNRHVEALMLPSLNHLRHSAATDAGSAYVNIDQTIAPLAVDRISAFSKRRH